MSFEVFQVLLGTESDRLFMQSVVGFVTQLAVEPVVQPLGRRNAALFCDQELDAGVFSSSRAPCGEVGVASNYSDSKSGHAEGKDRRR